MTPEEAADNEKIADILERVALLLDLKKEERSRIRSYRNAARLIRECDRPVAELVEQQGGEALTAFPGIGEKLAGAIQEIVEAGGLRLLDRLEDEVSREVPFTKVPGIDAETAARIHSVLGIETLEELEVGAHDGSLDLVDGLSRERIGEIRDALGRMLSRSARRRARPRPQTRGRRGPSRTEPPAALLLEIDEEYRAKAEADELKKIAPRRFNPEGKRWLPLMKTQRGGWSFTVLFSNTARAHELGKTTDWVVIYCKQAGAEEQCTVITAGAGPLRGRRVIPGREDECREHYGA